MTDFSRPCLSTERWKILKSNAISDIYIYIYNFFSLIGLCSYPLKLRNVVQDQQSKTCPTWWNQCNCKVTLHFKPPDCYFFFLTFYIMFVALQLILRLRLTWLPELALIRYSGGRSILPGHNLHASGKEQRYKERWAEKQLEETAPLKISVGTPSSWPTLCTYCGGG